VRQWILRIRPWGQSIFGGREVVGSGKSSLVLLADDNGQLSRDVAAGIAILLEAGGLVTTANPPDDINAPIAPVKLGSRLYLAIR
jgi:hypothetical protein